MIKSILIIINYYLQIMKKSSSIKYLLATFFIVAMIAILPSCTEEEPAPRPFAHFSAEASATNILEYTFTNLSDNSVSYAWDFGDGGSATEENPTHTYTSYGLFTVTLTASNADGESAIATHEVEITEPEVELEIIAGAESKKWIIQREGVALGIYAPDGGAWWEFAGDALGDRPCVFDDEITFFRDGTVQVDTKNTVYLDSEADGGWNDGLGAGCHEEDEAGIWAAADGSDVSDFANGGSYTFEYDKDTKVLTASGSGFYIGLTSKTNAGDNPMPISSKAYEVTKLVEGDGVDTLQLTLHIDNDGGKWIFNMVSYDDFSMAPEVPFNDPPPTLDPVNVLSIDHETETPWEVFGGSVVEIVDNPDKTGINASNKVLKLTHGHETWAGINIDIGGALDVTGKTKLKVKLLAPATGTLLFKLEVPGGDSQEISLDIAEADTWIELVWDLTTDKDGNAVVSEKYTKVVLFPGWDTTTADVFYIDDIIME